MLTKELVVSSHMTLWIVHEDLRYTSCVIKIRHMLTEDSKDNKFCRFRLLPNCLKNEVAGYLPTFSDENFFVFDTKINL